ncbi:hypothetical protein FA15DRAFT_639148 [Coprinopsis marcescibilis]|uniref:Splicing factor U2AF subunit n=1 Tax=Coprinopsis marcescibilis TaxID=230819 RepID=A0A5C3KYH6_COPMA|nr:hypothetical protein FA15DRAFT_639148 [Coprinopsis marcescibilis]
MFTYLFATLFSTFFAERPAHREERYRPSRHEEGRGAHRGGRENRGDRYGDRDDNRRGGGGGGGYDRDRDREGHGHGHRGHRGGRDFEGGGGRHRYDDDNGRRDRRRRDDDGPPGGREDGSTRDGGRRRGGGGRRDGTPDKRSPTPEGCPTLTQRKRKASGWDVHAPGYEQYTALQAKQTGLFNLPGANRTQIPPILGIPGLPPPVPVPTFGMGIGVNPNLSRQSRRLYIGSITPDVNEQNLADFFNQKMTEHNIGTGSTGNPVLAVQCNYEKNYAFVEFRSAEDATAAMAFDGIIFINGPLKIRRPKDYGGEMAPGSPGIHVPGAVSTNVPDSINKVFVGGLPTYLNEEQVMELLKSFGELRAFNLVRENGNGPSKGFAFFEYLDASVTDVAIQSLNGMELGDRYLVVQRASVGAKPGTPTHPGLTYDQYPVAEVPRPIMPAGQEITDARILLMLNMVTSDDLHDDGEYGDLYEDIKEECSKYGDVEDLRIPRPTKKDKGKWGEAQISAQDAQRVDEAAGVGRVYVKYVSTEGANKALNNLAGRSFAGRSIIATLLSEESQTTPPLNIIFAPQPEAPPPLPMEP